MKIGEVCLLTNDVPKIASFYRQLLGVEESSNDETHQFVLAEETALTVYNDGTHKNNQNQNICLAFTVEDMDKAYEKVLSLGAKIIEPPAKRPWGAISMSFMTLIITLFTLEAFRKTQKKSEQRRNMDRRTRL